MATYWLIRTKAISNYPSLHSYAKLTSTFRKYNISTYWLIETKANFNPPSLHNYAKLTYTVIHSANIST